MNTFLRRFLESSIKTGSLEVIDPAGQLHRFGDGSPHPVQVRFATPAVERAIVLNPRMKLGEAFMDGGVVVETGSIYDFLALILSNDNDPRPSWLSGFLPRFR